MSNLDYSKWDRLELSDDSDIEMHPNIDKRSFINWKRRDIHEKRMQNRQRMQDLEKAIAMNERLRSYINELVFDLELASAPSGKSASDFIESTISDWLAKHNDEETASEGGPTYTQMLTALAQQIKEKITDAPEGSVRSARAADELRKHEQLLLQQVSTARAELAELEQKMHEKITSEDIHMGFDSSSISHIDKPMDEAIVSAKRQDQHSGNKQKVTSIETVHNGVSRTSAARGHDTDLTSGSAADTEGENIAGTDIGQGESDENKSLKLTPTAEQFSRIEIGRYSECLEFLGSHSWLVDSSQHVDALLLAAFNWQMKGDERMAKQCVHQGLLLQYCRELGRDGVRIFFNRIMKDKSEAAHVFLEDVNSCYKRVQNRAVDLAQEESKEGVEQIQLMSTDPNMQISINIPEPEDVEARAIFESFPPNLRTALGSKNLDEINKVLGSMAVDEAEQIVEKLNAGNMLSIEEGIIDATKGDISEALERDVRENNMAQAPS